MAFFAHDGSNPEAMLATMRHQVGAYPNVRFLPRKAIDTIRKGDRFQVELEDGKVVTSATLLLAFGISDVLPEISGISERWGKSVIHCPYCHGYEVSGRRLGVLSLTPASLHQATLIPEWGPTTFFLNGGVIEPGAGAELQKRSVVIVPDKVEALVGEGAELAALRLSDGTEWPIEALFIGPTNRLNSDLPERLGCRLEPGMLGNTVTVDDMKATNVPGVFAAGNITRSGHTVTIACADGVKAALAIHRSLAFGA
jgi:thioredoxin reductase